MAYEETYSELGEFIHQMNPYGASGQWLLPGFQSAAKFDDKEREWNFDGDPKTVRQSIRIPYRYRDKEGRMKTEHLLIGYEGSGP